MSNTKHCSACKQIKDFAEFTNSTKTKDGKDARCRECKSIQFKQWMEANKERNIQRAKEWRSENPERNRANKNAWNQAHPEKARARAKQWAQNNPDKKRQLNRLWEIANPEKIRLKERNWRANNPQKVLKSNLRRRSRVRAGGIYAVSKKEIFAILSQPCFYCGSRDFPTVDHIVPVSRLGRHSIGNLIAACKSCNSSKRDRTIMEWRLSKAKREGIQPTH